MPAPSRLPTPEFEVLFCARLERLLGWLRAQLAGRESFVVVFPRESDPAAHARWIAQVEHERAAAPALTSFWLALPAPWPGIALPLRVGDALDLAANAVEAMALTMANQVRTTLITVADRKLLHATTARERFLVDRWPRPRPVHGPGALALHALTGLFEQLPEGETLPDRLEIDVGGVEQARSLTLSWPPEAAFLDVAQWARVGLNRAAPRAGDRLVEDVDRGLVPSDVTLPIDGPEALLPAAGIALAYLAERDVRTGLNRKMMAIDAGKGHHDVLTGMSTWPRDGRRHRGAPMTGMKVETDAAGIERVDLIIKGHPVQLSLPMIELEGHHDAAVDALRRARGAKGLRHWAAIQVQATEAGRTGMFRWFLDRHLEVMGYDERQCRDPKVRAEAAREVEILAAIEISVVLAGGVRRERGRWLLEMRRTEEIEDGEWHLNGLTLQINPFLYEGVRSGTGELGRRWMPAPAEIAAVDHVRFPHVHGLAMLFAIRSHWRLFEEHADHLVLTGDSLLRLAGIGFTTHREVRAWKALRDTLDELVHVHLLDHYAWDPDAAWTRTGCCRLYSAQWVLDRAGRALVADEAPPPAMEPPATGAELKVWREKHGWSMQQAANAVGVTKGAIFHAESNPKKVLGKRLREAIRSAAGTPGAGPPGGIGV